VERAYRDQRVNRIFEGTNEINRMLITGMLLKRAMKGQVPLLEFAQTVVDELANDALPRAREGERLAQEALLAEHLKRLAVYTLKVAVETYGPEIEQHQAVLASVADIVMDAFALDSMIARTRQYASGGELDPVRVALVQLYAWDAQARSLDRARRAVCSVVSGDAVKAHLAQVEKLAPFTACNPAELREVVLGKMEAEGGYPITQP
jgi:alkylation response protein AidB-like acyl-CoA dehydrogenase